MPGFHNRCNGMPGLNSYSMPRIRYPWRRAYGPIRPVSVKLSFISQFELYFTV
jgi:hypothetical protein